MVGPFLLSPATTGTWFPDVELALDEPNGLLAVGGNLSPPRLMAAYRAGIFPWYNHDQPILWWSPNPRLVMFPDKLRVSRSLQKTIKKNSFQITFDCAFGAVITACAQPRAQEKDTWISQDISQAYTTLYELGHAHSVEVWYKNELVGGLYGIAIGKVFFGESMFHRMSNASKVAYVGLIEQLKIWGFQLIDCQVETEHLLSLGAENISRRDFTSLLEKWCNQETNSDWKCETNDLERL